MGIGALLCTECASLRYPVGTRGESAGHRRGVTLTSGGQLVHQRPIKVLLVESDREYLEELRERLGDVRSADGIDVEWAGELSEALARLTQGGIDAILLDLELPDSEGPVTFERTYAFAPDVPIIVLTDISDESVAVSTVQGGAQDYLVKDEVSPPVLARSVRHAIERL